MIDEKALQEKLKVLTEAARYDASCASCGTTRDLGNGASTSSSGICHSWAADGRCISLLKILMTNHCRYDCAYCVNRCSNTKIERAELTPEELVALTINFYKRNYIEGLFLSSGIRRSPDETLMQMVEVARQLRQEHRFLGYIHMKIIPGASPELIYQAGIYADRLSVNLELPSEESLKQLAPQKSKLSIFDPMRYIHHASKELTSAPSAALESPQASSSSLPAVSQGRLPASRRKKKKVVWTPAGQSTQMIVGASPETDYTILRLSQGLYKKYELKRVYYSAYIPINEDTRLPAVTTAPPLCREHRLYQADWLLRFYHFDAEEILSPQFPNLEENVDPKAGWALRNLNLFPIDAMTASLEMLLRVPGIGPISARRIVKARRHSHLREPDLKRIGVVLKRARFFLDLGQYKPGLAKKADWLNQDRVLAGLLGDGVSQSQLMMVAEQPTLYQPRLFE